MKLVSFKAPDALMDLVDRLVEAGRYASRSEAIRAAILDLVRRELNGE